MGIHDSFFSIGGDSISAIRLVSRARAKGVHFGVRDVFTYQSPEGLSGIARDGSDVGVQVWPEEGAVPLLPIFRDVLSMPGPIDRFNQTVCLEVPEGVTHDGVVSALDRLRAYHSVLRLRTEGRGIGTRLVIDPVEALPSLELPVLDMGQFDGADPEEYVSSCIEDLSLSLSPGVAGGMLAPLWVLRPDGCPLLVLTLHHFVVDGVSWRILIEDLSGLTLDASYVLPSKTMSFLSWSERLRDEGAGGVRRGEEALWRGQVRDGRLLPQDYEITPEQNTHASAEGVHGLLSASDTEQLLRAPNTYRGGINDVLLTALGLALCGWSKTRYGHDLGDPVIALEGHGREDGSREGDDREGAVDLSQTVGWFTSLFPVRLGVGDLSVSDIGGIGYGIRRIKECLRSFPDNGLGYGILRHLDDGSSLGRRICSPPRLYLTILVALSVWMVRVRAGVSLMRVMVPGMMVSVYGSI